MRAGLQNRALRPKPKSAVKNPLEDTQIAFYAVLLPHDTLQAAYINVGERDGYAVPSGAKDIVLARDALVEGIAHGHGSVWRLVPCPCPRWGDGPGL